MKRRQKKQLLLRQMSDDDTFEKRLKKSYEENFEDERQNKMPSNDTALQRQQIIMTMILKYSMTTSILMILNLQTRITVIISLAKKWRITALT
jgi:hypothetical protein